MPRKKPGAAAGPRGTGYNAQTEEEYPMARKYGPKAQEEVHKAMHEMK